MNAYQLVKHCDALGIIIQLHRQSDQPDYLTATPDDLVDNQLARLIQQHRQALMTYLGTGNALALIPDDESLWTTYTRWTHQQIKSRIALLKNKAAADQRETARQKEIENEPL